MLFITFFVGLGKNNIPAETQAKAAAVDGSEETKESCSEGLPFAEEEEGAEFEVEEVPAPQGNLPSASLISEGTPS